MYGAILKSLREERKLTQTEVAKQIGLTQRMVSKYECEIVEMNFETLIKFANFFNCSIDYLLGREDDFGFIQITGEDYTSSEKRIISIYRGLSEREREIFDNLVNSFDDKAEIKKSSRA
ncbi:MAG: helix-turn-helix transcriptional regulator [Clostridia bacterium]|nr:helix-turn-helix transcriptional regulator [Clostridia bacterium]